MPMRFGAACTLQDCDDPRAPNDPESTSYADLEADDVQCDGPPERVSRGKPIAAVPAACSWLEFAVSA